VVSPEGPEDFEINPQADINRERSLLLHDGHSGVEPPITSVSKLLSQLLHLYSYIGIKLPQLSFSNQFYIKRLIYIFLFLVAVNIRI